MKKNEIFLGLALFFSLSLESPLYAGNFSVKEKNDCDEIQKRPPKKQRSANTSSSKKRNHTKNKKAARRTAQLNRNEENKETFQSYSKEKPRKEDIGYKYVPVGGGVLGYGGAAVLYYDGKNYYR